MDTSTGVLDASTADSNSEPGYAVLAGAGLIALSGLLHLGLTPEYVEAAAYLGGLFVLEFAAAAVAAVGIYRGRRWGWWLGVAVSVGAILGYLVYGTVGLPMAGSEELLEPIGVLAKAVEVAFLGVAAVGLSD